MLCFEDGMQPPKQHCTTISKDLYFANFQWTTSPKKKSVYIKGLQFKSCNSRHIYTTVHKESTILTQCGV